MAKTLVAQLETPFEPKAYRDEHRERVLEMLQQKATGQPIDLTEAPEQEALAARLRYSSAAWLARRASLQKRKKGSPSHTAGRDPGREPQPVTAKSLFPALQFQ